MPSNLADWLAYIERQHPKSIDMGLERVRAVAARMGLGRPARQVVTVGGTNGKGSTVAFIEAIALAAGWKVGAYTSPHLLAYNERVRIDGRDASDAELVQAFEAIEVARLSPSPTGIGERIRRSDDGSDASSFAVPSSTPSGHLLPEGEGTAVSLTYFEYGTLAALWLFERADLELAILEVGLGGRLDAVNLVDADVAVITTVDLDHQNYLGEDREGIGFEKAGIARAWKPLVLGEDDPPSSVLGHAYAIGAATWRAGSDFFFERIDEHHWRWREVGHELLLPLPALAAPVQMRNAATAIAALRALEAPDKAIPDAAHAEGVAKARLPGRLQRFERDGVEIVVDVGHNPQAARELAAWLGAAAVPGRTFAVYAALGDKDVVGVANALAAQVDDWFLAGLEAAGPRGIAVTEFARRLAGTAAGKGGRHPDVESALAAARAQARPGDRILVFGSFHTVAAALPLLQAPGS
jgi:dihydrofolate synthase/folylpolyglutamate synthase